MKIFLILLGMMLSLGVSAGDKVYKTVDEKGNVIFSDVPVEGSQEIDIPPASTFKPPVMPPAFKSLPSYGEDTYSYELLEITSPENDTVFADEEANSIAVSVKFEPALRFDHKLVLKVNDEPHPGMTLTNLTRGTHTLVAEIINAAGEVVISSPIVQIHIHQSSYLPGARPQPPFPPQEPFSPQPPYQPQQPGGGSPGAPKPPSAPQPPSPPQPITPQ